MGWLAITTTEATGLATTKALAIATTTAPSNIHSLISANLKKDMLELFEVIGAGDLLIRKKPAPDVYLWVMQRLGLPPEACLAIEDSSIGLTAARAAGLPTVITVSTDEICAAIKDIYDDTRSITEPAGALGVAGIKK